MNLISLENYRVRGRDSYYDSGYYLADMMSLHNTISHFEDLDVEFAFSEEDGILARIGKRKSCKDVVSYNPITLHGGTEPDELFYIVAHELAHIKNNDYWKILAFGIFTTFIMAFLGIIVISLTFIEWLFPFSIIGFLFSLLGKAWFLRRRETLADIGALDYVSPMVIMKQIDCREPYNKLGWLLYDHATTKTFTRWYGKLVNER